MINIIWSHMRTASGITVLYIEEFEAALDETIYQLETSREASNEEYHDKGEELRAVASSIERRICGMESRVVIRVEG